MLNVDLTEILKFLGPYLASLAAGILSYFLGRKKNSAETALITGQVEKQAAETVRYIDDTKWSTIERQGNRLKMLEDRRDEMEEERKLYEQRITAKNLEISILRQQLIAEKARVERYKKIAIVLQGQLESANLVPHYNVRDEDIETKEVP